MYLDQPYAREVGHVGGGTGVATTAGGIDGHDIPPDVQTGVVFWLRKGQCNLPELLDRQNRVERVSVLLQPHVHGCGTSEGLQGLPTVQDRPVLQRRVSETRLDCGWAQGDMWHI